MNLDKTMFQEACATAHNVKTAVTGSRYYLLCEWLDMTPQSTEATDIDQVLILRKAKRMNSNIRSLFGTSEARKKNKDRFIEFLQAHPFSSDVFLKFVSDTMSLLKADELNEQDVLQQGFF